MSMDGAALAARAGGAVAHAAGGEPAGRAVSGNTEVRTVPSPLFPTIAAALAQPSVVSLEASGGRGSVPNLVIRILPGVYHEQLCITRPAILVGVEDSLPTIHGSGLDGLRIAAGGATSCVLRKLRLCAEAQGRAVTVDDSSPLIEGCELVGTGGDPVRGAPAGLQVRGADSHPIIRGCRISGHAGAGVSFGSGAQGLVVACDISRCACGVWLEGDANPLLWRNTIAGHRGAGVVVRAGARGLIMGNTVLRNGAGGVLVESSRSSVTKIAQNRVWSNIGWDLRQSPAPPGFSAGEVGALLISNIVGQQGSDTSSAPGIELAPAWPKRVVNRASELVAAVRGAPRNRIALVEIVGRLVLEEPLVLDRPVVLAGRKSSTAGAELCGAAGLAAVVVVAPGGEAAALCQLTIRLLAQGPGTVGPRPGASCVDIVAGSPTLIDCELVVEAPGRGKPGASSRGVQAPVPTHALRVAGPGVEPLIAGCALQGAAGAGALIDAGASVSFLQCEISGNQQGGIFLGESSRLRLEACEVSRNGHFGIVVGPGASTAFVGRTNLSSNTAGGIWHCGGQQTWDASGCQIKQFPLWLDECSVAATGVVARRVAAGPAIVVGAGADLVLWDTLFNQQMTGKYAIIRMEASTRCVVACDGPGLSGWGRAMPGAGPSSLPIVGSGTVVWLDVSGAAPPQQLAPRRVEVEFPPRSTLQRPYAEAEGQRPAQVLDEHWPQRAESGDKPTHSAEQEEILASESAQAQPGALAWPGSGTGFGGSPRRGESAGELDEGAGDGAAEGSGDDGVQAASEHLQWLRLKMQKSQGDLANSEQNRQILFAVLGMLVDQSRCKDAIDSVGLGGQLRSGDVVYIRGHTGRWFGVRGSATVCNKADRPSAMQFVLESKSHAPKHESKVAFRLVEPPDANAAGGMINKLGVTASSEVKAMPRREGSKDAETQFVVLTPSTGAVGSGLPVFLKSVGVGRILEVDGEVIRARNQDTGTHQRLFIEKLPTDSEVPAPCQELDLSIEEKAWLFRRGVEFALIDKQKIASFLAGHKPMAKELLKAYTRLWEGEWRRDWKAILGESKGDTTPGDDGSNSPASRQSRPVDDEQSIGTDQSVAATSSQGPTGRPRANSRTRMSKRDRIMTMFQSGTIEDKNNGNLFISALRSFFATALRMSQLEADPVQRVIEAFAEALVSDASFLECFTTSMLPEAERKTYKTPEEVLFGLTYTTLMLNTDMHNKQVGQKMWDTKKFVGAGKDCGVTGGLMMQIFKNVQKEEL